MSTSTHFNGDVDDALTMNLDPKEPLNHSHEFLNDIEMSHDDFQALPDDFFKDFELPPQNELSLVSLDHSLTDEVFNDNLHFDFDELMYTQEEQIEFSSPVSVDHSTMEKDQHNSLDVEDYRALKNLEDVLMKEDGPKWIDVKQYNEIYHGIQVLAKPLEETLINNIESKSSNVLKSPSALMSVQSKKVIPWTDEEHRLFLIGLKRYGRKWTKISRNVVRTRSPSQVSSHAQKYFIRNDLPKEKKKRKSIHDTVFQDLHTIDQPNRVLAPKFAMQMSRQIQPLPCNMPYQIGRFGYSNINPNHMQQQNWVSHPNHATQAKVMPPFNLPNCMAYPMGGYGYANNTFLM